ncbi:baseplate J/gp47 family protein [Rhizobium sp. No.120]
MATTPVCTIDATGIHVPSYTDVLTYLQNAYRAIYGADVYLEPDSQDGQLLAIFALAISDANSMAAAVYNSFSPATAQGAGLSSVVKLNGIQRGVASYSSVDLTLIGQAGTTINNGIASDTNGNQWLLPASVTIPSGGEIIATAMAAEAGAITADVGSVTTIATPTRGWQSVTNASAAAVGAPVEDDATLRKRQTTSTMLPNKTVLEGVVGAVANLTGVTRYAAYDNDTDVTDANGIPGHTFALVIEGGDAQTIANTIALKKGEGAGTFGTTSETVIDSYGVSHVIRFSRPTLVPISVAITVKALGGYTTTVENSIKDAVAAEINATAIGGGQSGVVEWDSAVSAAKGVPSSAAFRVTSLTLSRASGAGTPDVPLAFNEASACDVMDITVTVI